MRKFKFTGHAIEEGDTIEIEAEELRENRHSLKGKIVFRFEEKNFKEED